MVVDDLINVLNPLVDNNVYRQGTVTKEYPDLFITFFEVVSKGGSHYDNKPNSNIYNFDVNVYGKDVDAVYNTLDSAIAVLKENGFIVDGKGIDVPSDDAEYIGRHIEIIKIEREV
ncbi:MAG: hypothetical protein MJ151_00120 [Lachnospiraceae bacterium]|nr:hypothetical protein [Lachnospiraceae bacterium]